MNLRKQLKQKFRNRENVFAAWTSIGNPQITEAFTNIGVDFVGIDIEHGTISYEQNQRIIAASQAGGTCCLPRIDSHSMPMTKRLMDSGADGLIVPMVDTPEQVEQLISWVKYPPVGKRSYGINRGQNYGFDFDEYTQNWNDSSSLIIQIESTTGVANIEKLLNYAEIDGAMVGPYDLSGSLGIPGQLEHSLVKDAAQKVIDACKAAGKSCGTQLVDPDAAGIQGKLDEGYNFIVLSSDIFLLWTWGEKIRDEIALFRK